MKYLWLLWLPLLYLPSFSLISETDLGTLELSDFFIGPLLIFTYLRIQEKWHDRFKTNSRIYVHYIIPILIMFLWWAFIASISIGLRYDYSNMYQVNFSLLKVAKLFLYGLTAMLIIFALSKSSRDEYILFLWSFLICGLLVGGGLFLTGNGNSTGFIETQGAEVLFKDNGVSAMLSIYLAFLIGMLITKQGSKFWRRAASIGLILIVLGFVSARGRGGWVAAVVALVFIGVNINFTQTFRMLIISIILFTFAYNNNSTFKSEVDKTLTPSYSNEIREQAGIGLDDGARLYSFVIEANRLIEDPLFGRGLFHRGSKSGIWSTGSHNMFLQMFLETGIVGGILVILLIRQMWLSASTDYVKKQRLDIPVKTAIVAAVVVAQSGEYFYGGMVLFTLFLTYAVVGRIQQDEHNPFEHAI